MSRTNWPERKMKELVRAIAVEKWEKYAKTAMMLPAEELICLKAAVKNGLIKINTTFLHIVEKETKIASLIREEMEQMGWKKDRYHLHVCELHEVQLPKTTKIEYAFLDVCGGISPGIVRWLHDNQPNFSSTARIGLTFCSHVRNSSCRELPDEINQTLTIDQKRESLKLLLQADGNWLGETFGLVKKGSTKAGDLVAWNNQQEIMKAIFSGVFCALSDSMIEPTFAIQYKEPGYATTMHFLEVKLKPLDNKQKRACRFSWISHLAPELVKVSARRRRNQAKRRAA